MNELFNRELIKKAYSVTVESDTCVLKFVKDGGYLTLTYKKVIHSWKVCIDVHAQYEKEYDSLTTLNGEHSVKLLYGHVADASARRFWDELEQFNFDEKIRMNDITVNAYKSIMVKLS